LSALQEEPQKTRAQRPAIVSTLTQAVRHEFRVSVAHLSHLSSYPTAVMLLTDTSHNRKVYSPRCLEKLSRCKMNLPGFTAEVSLYRESGHYRTTGAHTHADGAIQPAGSYPPIGPLIRAALRDLLNPQPLPPQASIRGHYRVASCYSSCSNFCAPWEVFSAECRPGKPPDCLCW
jgi:hypothetical protein